MTTVKTTADALHAPATSWRALETGYREWMTRAEKIGDPDWRKSFLENVSEHRAIVEMWERTSR